MLSLTAGYSTEPIFEAVLMSNGVLRRYSWTMKILFSPLPLDKSSLCPSGDNSKDDIPPVASGTMRTSPLPQSEETEFGAVSRS